MAELVQLDTRRRHAIGTRFTIGRAEDCDLRLEDPLIALRHAEIVTLSDGSHVIRDLGTRRGTYVGTRKVREPEPLRDGDELLVGPTRFRFEQAAVADPDEVRKLRAMVELTRAIGVEHDLEQIARRVLDTCFQLLRADRGMIITYLPGSKTPAATFSCTRTGETNSVTLSTSVVSQLLQTREPIVATTIDDDALQRAESLAAHGVTTLLAVPLIYMETEWLGVLYLDARAASTLFTSRDLELAVAIAGQASLAVRNAMLVQQLQTQQSDDWRRLERVVASLPVGVAVLDHQQRCVLANDWIRQRESAIGRIEKGAIVEHIAGQPMARYAVGNVREQLPRGEQTFIIDAQTSPDTAETVIVLTDITEERAQQAKIAHQDRLALIGQLSGGIAHDFNNLLFVILNNAENLAEAATDPQVRDDIGQITQAAQTASGLVRQLLAFSRREVVKPRVIDVSIVVGELEKIVKRAVGDGVIVHVELPRDQQFVLMDPSQLEQIVMNLAVNGRDAMNGSGALSIAVRAEDHVVIEVTDSGSGMSPETIARVFEPYFTTKAIGKGTGLGLATVHGIVEHARGTITVTSELGRGTTFRIALPRTNLSTRIPLDSVAGTRGTVVVVDDDDTVLRVTERMLRTAGYRVFTATSGQAALDELERHPAAFLVTDIVMPGMSGRELAREALARCPAMRVLFVSGYTAGTPVPASQFLAKPFDRPSLLRKLDELDVAHVE